MNQKIEIENRNYKYRHEELISGIWIGICIGLLISALIFGIFGCGFGFEIDFGKSNFEIKIAWNVLVNWNCIFDFLDSG